MSARASTWISNVQSLPTEVNVVAAKLKTATHHALATAREELKNLMRKTDLAIRILSKEAQVVRDRDRPQVSDALTDAVRIQRQLNTMR